MEPWLQYTTTADGVSIAYAVAGSGPPLVRITGGLWDHAQGYWRVTPMRKQLERLAGHFTHIQYDARGTGLSQRGCADFGIEAQLTDLEAVVAGNHLDQFNLLCHYTGGFAGMAYAARNPGRVSRLILFHPHTRGTDYFNERAMRAMAAYRQMAAEDWFGYLTTISNRTLRFEHPDIARQLLTVYNESMTPETVRLFEEQYSKIDVSDAPAKIECPTLIIVGSGRTGLSEDVWREVAGTISDVSLVMMRPDMPLSFKDETTDAILSFLGEEQAGQSRTMPAEALQVLLYIAIEGPQASYEAALREIVLSRGALRFLSAPGGFVASFRSAQMALESASTVQQAVTGQGDPAHLRIGVDAVDQTAADTEYLSDPGQRAVMAGKAAADGEVLVTDVVRQLVTGKGFLFSARPEIIDVASDEPVSVYELRWRG